MNRHKPLYRKESTCHTIIFMHTASVLYSGSFWRAIKSQVDFLFLREGCCLESFFGTVGSQIKDLFLHNSLSFFIEAEYWRFELILVEITAAWPTLSRFWFVSCRLSLFINMKALSLRTHNCKTSFISICILFLNQHLAWLCVFLLVFQNYLVYILRHIILRFFHGLLVKLYLFI